MGCVLAPHPGLCPLSQGKAAGSWWVQEKPSAFLSLPQVQPGPEEP